MTKLNTKHETFATIKKNYLAEQVLNFFGIEIDSYNKCLCVFHKETLPSMQVYEDSVFCFGCRTHASVFTLAKHLLEQQAGKTLSLSYVINWFNETAFPKKSNRKYTASSNYEGEVPLNLVEYWHNQLTEEMYQQLAAERLFTKETVDKYLLGWRPDSQSYTIPFWRGELGNSPVDIIQFRRLEGRPKYYGLYAHNRGSIMNAYLLETPQEYNVVLFGAFDSLLAVQDGLVAEGTNGCFPFKDSEKERVQKLFSKQKTTFIVPDNSPQEYASAYKLAEWLSAEVRFFDTELPEGTDYIDYRKLGFTVEDFKQDVLGIQPITQIPGEYLSDIKDYIQAGDPCQLASVYAIMSGRGLVATDVARTLAKEAVKPFNERNWPRKKLWSVRTSDDLVKILNSIAIEANRLTGAW